MRTLARVLLHPAAYKHTHTHTRTLKHMKTERRGKKISQLFDERFLSSLSCRPARGSACFPTQQYDRRRGGRESSEKGKPSSKEAGEKAREFSRRADDLSRLARAGRLQTYTSDSVQSLFPIQAFSACSSPRHGILQNAMLALVSVRIWIRRD